MNNHLHLRLGFAVVTLVLFGAACGVAQVADGGVYRTGDSGKTWQQVVFVGQDKKRVVRIDNVDVNQIVVSPINSSTLYAVSNADGIFLSDNKGDQWKQIAKGPLTSFALHSKVKETLYATAGNRVSATIDGGATWQTLYIENTPQVGIAQVLVDSQQPDRVFALTTKGGLLRSLDKGSSWQLLYTFTDRVLSVVQNPRDTRILYGSVVNGTLWRSADAGQTWLQLVPPQVDGKPIKFGAFRALAFLPEGSDAFLYASQYGLARTLDGGQNWTLLQLVTRPNTVAITGLAIDAKNSQHLSYVAGSAFYRSTDAGRTWETLRLPSSRIPTSLASDPGDGNILYLGFTKPKKK